MERFYGSLIGQEVVLSEGDVHRLIRKRKLKKGATFLFVADEHLYLARLSKRRPFRAQVIERLKDSGELRNDVVFVFSPLKDKKRTALILELAAELGVEEVICLLSAKTKVKIKRPLREHWLKKARVILKAASARAGRLRIPLLYQILPFARLADLRADIRLIAHDDIKGEKSTLANCLKRVRPGEKIMVMVGPEEGYAPKEVDRARDLGFHVISLGARSLTPFGATAALLGAIKDRLKER